MNKINRRIEYALMALKHLSSKTPGELTTVKEITDAYGCPFDATARVLQQLGQHDILRSEQGAAGGYMLMKDLLRLSFYELIEILLGPVGVAKCLHEGGGCELLESCNIVTPVQVLNSRLVDFYRSLSVKELIFPNPKFERSRMVVNYE